jgi:opacity protein-like surface antigen
MKKLMMIAAMMVAAVSANAQFEPGTFSIQPKVGGIVSKVSNMPNINLGQFDLGNTTIDRSFYVGGLIGAEFEYQVAQPFSLAAGVNFAMQGCQWDDFEYKVGDNTLKLKDTKMELTYLNVPVVANFYLFKGFAIKAGVQVGFLTSAKMKMSSEVKIGDQTTKSTQDTDIKDGCKKVDFSIPMGVSYQVPTIPIYIDARYNLGLTNINKEGDTNYKNQVFQLTVGYKFAL